MLTALTIDDYVVVNRAELGAASEPGGGPAPGEEPWMSACVEKLNWTRFTFTYRLTGDLLAAAIRHGGRRVHELPRCYAVLTLLG